MEKGNQITIIWLDDEEPVFSLEYSRISGNKVCREFEYPTCVVKFVDSIVSNLKEIKMKDYTLMN